MRELWKNGPRLAFEPQEPMYTSKGMKVFGTKGRLTEAEIVVRNQDMRERHEVHHLAWEEQVKQIKAAWPKLQIKLLQHDIHFLQDYRRAATIEEKWHFRDDHMWQNYWMEEEENSTLFDADRPWRYHLICDKEKHDKDVFFNTFSWLPRVLRVLSDNNDLTKSIYIGWCPTRKLHKIGSTTNQLSRFRWHKKYLDKDVVTFGVYHTTVDHEKLEKLLHYHFWHWHVRREETAKSEETAESEDSIKSDELFRLSEAQASEFGAVVQKLEDLLVDAELFRLKGILARFEAERQ